MQEHLEAAQKNADEARAIITPLNQRAGAVEGRLLLAVESLIAALDLLTDSE